MEDSTEEIQSSKLRFLVEASHGESSPYLEMLRAFEQTLHRPHLPRLHMVALGCARFQFPASAEVFPMLP